MAGAKTPIPVSHYVWSAAAGAVAVIIVGFGWAGWNLGGTTEKIATQRAVTAVVAALAPICAEQVMALPDGPALKIALGATQSSYTREGLFKGDALKWVTLPGQQRASSELASACAELILKPTAPAAK